MAQFDNTTELSLKNEGISSSTELSGTSGDGKSRAKSSNAESIDSKGSRKKKEDALEGKETKEARGESDSDDEGHHAADKAEADDSGTHSRQGLQSGQTTVQFSSGGGVGGGNANMASSLGSLLGLFASSASLVRAEGGVTLNVANQSVNLTLRAAFQASNNQIGSLLNEEGRLKGNVEGGAGQVSESASSKFNPDTGGSTTSHSGGNILQGISSDLLTSVSAQGAEGGKDQGSSNTITVISSIGTTAIYTPLTFNASGSFINTSTPFAFPNSATSGSTGSTGTGSPLAPYSGVAGAYLKGAAQTGGFSLAPTSTYSYQLLSPLAIPPGSSGASPVFASGVTFATTSPAPTLTPLAYSASAAPSTPITTSTDGLTLTAAGDLYVNVTAPISVYVDILSPGNPAIPVRINAGPSDGLPSVTAPNDSALTNRLIGNFVNGQFQNTVFVDNTATNTVIGTDADLRIGSSGTGSTLSHSFSISNLSSLSSLPSSGVFPSNTIYEHFGITTIGAFVPTSTQAVYGNFANAGFVGGGTIDLPRGTASYNLTMGGNVLDVYGTKYGVADTLDIVLPASGTATNTLTMGGNTLAGFGTSYGDLKNLTVSAQSGNSPTTLGPTDLMFRGNDLAVDKDVSSTLYPHLQTLDMEEAASTGTPSSLIAPANVKITFQDSIIQGNAVVQGTGGTGGTTTQKPGDVFYGDIQNLSNSSSTSYNGFLMGVNVTDVGGQVVTTTLDGKTTVAGGDNNSITWGNDIYTGGALSPTDSTVVANNTYNFTLLLDGATQQAVMQGNALITNANIKTDTDNFKISPALFRALDGADNLGHDKVLTAADLDASVKFAALSQSSVQSIDPLFGQYLSENGLGAATGTTITFDNGLGGSISLVGLPSLTSFAGIPYTTNVTFTYAPVAAIPVPQIIAANPTQIIATTPAEGLFIYSVGPDPKTPFYYNELDNFFANSLYATYTISGAPAAVQYVLAPIINPAPSGVAIDQFGTISVDKTATTPILTPITITATSIDSATHQTSTAQTTQFFGFLHAPITDVETGGTVTSPSNILIGGIGSTLVGEPNLSGGSTDALSLSTAPGGTPGTPMIGQTLPTFGSNLIVDVKGGAQAYGDFQHINFTADGALSAGAPGAANVLGAINQNQFIFAANAFYVLNGAVIDGVAQDFDVTAQGGQNSNVSVGYDTGTSLFNATAEFNNNIFNFGPQTIYGSGPSGGGPIYGGLHDMNISAIAGNGATLSETGGKGFNSIPGSASLDLSSQVEGNTFTFGNVQITVKGDATGDTTSLYPNAQDLSVTVDSTSSTSSDGNLSLLTTATFSGNQFIFGNATLTGGAGNTNFYPDVNLNDNTSPNAYNGFINGVTTSLNPAGQLVTTTSVSDGSNSIAWGKDTLTGGHGINIYNFTLLSNSAPGPVTEQLTPDGFGGNVVTVTDPAAVFTGVDEITNLNLTGNATTTDQLVFTLEPNLYVEMVPLLAIPNQASPLSLLDLVSTFTHTASTLGDPNGNTIITFDAPSGGNNGTLMLDNVYISNFGELESFFPGSLVINVANVNPTLNANAVFDPVFVNGSQPGAFSSFINNPSNATLTYTPISSSNGITLDSYGTLTVSVSGIVDMSLKGIDATTASGEVIPLPAVHIFALGDSNATSVDVDTTSSFISGSPSAAAYEVAAGTVFGGGANVILENTSLTYGSHLIDDTSTVTHTIYGDMPNIDNDPTTSITGQTFNFDPNLMNINIGASLADRIFGDAKNLSISVSGTTNTPFSNNVFIFGAVNSSATSSNILDTGNAPYNKGSYISGNILYGSGSLEGSVQTITLSDSSSDVNSTINGDVFIFGGNSLTNGAYLNGTNILTSSTGTNLYANATTLTITGTAVNQITGNTFVFADDTLNGESASTNFFGHLSSFSDFYNGVTTSTITTSGETFLSIDENNSNVITWGNDTYTGGTTGNNTYNFTIVGDTFSRPVMQGFDTITNFNLTSDKLVFSLPNALYTSLAGAGNILTPTMFLSDLTLQGSTLSFPGGGSITLSGLSSQNLSTLASDITIVTTSPGTVIQNPASTVVVFGNTANADTWSNLFNTTDPLAATLPNGITFNANVGETVTGFGNNTGIINTTVPTVTVNDFGTTLISGTSATNPVQLLGLDGTLIDQPVGTPEQGDIGPDVFIGHGNVITGGGADLQYGASITAPSGTYALVNPLPSDYTRAKAAIGTTVTNPPLTEAYASKLIYDVAPAPTNPVTGDVQNITDTVQGLSNAIFNSSGGTVDGSGDLTGIAITMANNFIEVVPASSATNFDAQATYGNGQTIFLSATGGENVYTTTITTSKDDAKIHDNSITTSGNTLIAPGVVYGADQAISLKATDGFYATQTPAPSTAPENLAAITKNNFTIGNNIITETGTGTDIAYGVSKSVSLQVTPAATSLENAAFTAALASSSGLEIGNSKIDNNTFNFGHNTLTGGQGTSSLFAGVGQLTIENNEPASTPSATQPMASEITGNTFVFQDSTLTATSGTTNFYDDVANLGSTNFSDYGVSATNVSGHVQVTDVAGTGLLTPHDATVSGNVITFGNDMMTASTTAGSTNIFNLNLLVTTNGSIVAEGDTAINKFGAPGAPNTNMLNLQLTPALYDDILAANGMAPGSTAVPITGIMMDNYLAAHNGSITDTGGNAAISFSDGLGNTSGFGSIALPGVTLSTDHLSNLGTNLEITADGQATITAANYMTSNTPVFADATLIGGSIPTNFFGHLSSFSTFYSGVTVTSSGGSGESFLTIHDSSGDTITWGNDTYTGATAGNNTYHFTTVGNAASQPVMQGFDTITNFNALSDKLVFALPTSYYTNLAGGVGNLLTSAMFLNDLTLIPQGTTSLTLSFTGGGSITLSGLSSQPSNATLASDITIVTTNPGTVVQTPTHPVVVFGNTANVDTWSNLFTATDPLAATLPNGITFNANGTVSFGANTGIINTTVPTVTVNDLGTNLTSNTTAANPVQILGLNGTLIDQPIGTPEQGATGTDVYGTEADAFIGHGNIITGGGADLQYGASITPVNAFTLTNPLPTDYTTATAAGSTTVTNPPSTEAYASKLIYDTAPAPTNPVTGDVQNITDTVQGLSGAIFNGGSADGSSTLTGATITMASNFIDVVPASSATNFDAQQTYGNGQTVSFSATGGENVYNVTTSTDDAKIQGNSVTTGNNTIIAPGTVYGADKAISLTATDGFYATQTPAPSSAPENLAAITKNNFTIGNNIITETGTGTDIAYGVSKSVSLQVAPAATSLESPAFTAALPTSSGLEIGNSKIDNNTFNFGANHLTGGQGTSSLFPGVDQLIIENNEPASLSGTQPAPSEITGNSFVFHDSIATAMGGTTNFHDDVANLGSTNFSDYGVSAINVSGHVQVTDVAGTGLLTPHDATVSGNVITFGNDMMTASTTAGSTNIFNLNLMVTASGNIVAEGDTTINNFGAPGAPNTNMLNLQLTPALYNDILTANSLPTGGAAVPITGAMLDSYLAAHNGSITETNGNAVISFSDGSGSNNNFGSIALDGVTLPTNHVSNLGTNLEITADGITTIDPPPSPTNVYHIDMSGNTTASYTQDTHIVDVSSLGHIVDFAGTVDLNMSNTLFKALGLSDANTAAQNLQTLQQDAHTATGGIAVTETTSGTGASAVVNTVLTFEATVGSVVNNFGSVTLHNTHFNAADPLSAHLTVTHH